MRLQTVRSSVQEEYVRLREISGDMLCLASPSSPTQRTYRAVLEVSAINFTLKSEDEQEAIIAGYTAPNLLKWKALVLSSKRGTGYQDLRVFFFVP